MSSFVTKSLIAVAGATVLGLTSLGFVADAQAAPNEPEANKSCWTKMNGQDVGHPAGTTITINNGGNKVTYKCNGKTGEWEKVPLVVSGLSRVTFDSRSTTLVGATPAFNPATTFPSSPSRPLAR